MSVIIIVVVVVVLGDEVCLPSVRWMDEEGDVVSVKLLINKFIQKETHYLSLKDYTILVL